MTLLRSIVKQAQRIQECSRSEGWDKEGIKGFPNLIWLLRDAAQRLPEDCVDVKDYFRQKVGIYRWSDNSYLGLLHMSHVTGTNFALDSYEKFQPGFGDEKKAKNPGDEFWCETRETEQTWQNTKIMTFAPIIALATLAAVSLKLNGMLMMWKIQKAMQNDAIWVARIHPSNRAEVFTWQNFQLAYRDRGWKNRDLGNTSQPAL